MGQKYLIDTCAVIAATAMTFNFVLLSDNDKYFLKVEPLGLKYLNPKTAFIT